MINLPPYTKKITPVSATVDFYEFKEESITYYYFDTSFSSAPEPMINAMIGLRLLDTSNKRLIMINHSIPVGLFPKIKENFEYEVEELNDGNYEIVFRYKAGTAPVTNFSDDQCAGGCDC